MRIWVIPKSQPSGEHLVGTKGVLGGRKQSWEEKEADLRSGGILGDFEEPTKWRALNWTDEGQK